LPPTVVATAPAKVEPAVAAEVLIAVAIAEATVAADAPSATVTESDVAPAPTCETVRPSLPAAAPSATIKSPKSITSFWPLSAILLTSILKEPAVATPATGLSVVVVLVEVAKLSAPVMLTISTFLTVRPVRLVLSSAVAVMFKVSVPAPPSRVSPLFMVVSSAPVFALTVLALNVLSAPLPENSSIPVVSVKVWYGMAIR